jgi:hypothetical protein
VKERLVGLVLVASGALLSYLCIYQPLEAAWGGAPTVKVSLKGAILAPIGLIGIMYLVMGARATVVMGTREKPTPAAYVIGIGAVVLGIGVYLWLRTTLESHGYDFGGRF